MWVWEGSKIFPRKLIVMPSLPYAFSAYYSFQRNALFSDSGGTCADIPGPSRMHTQLEIFMGESSAVILHSPLFFGKKKKRVAQYVEFEQFGDNIVRPAILFKYCNCWVILWLCAPTFVPYDLYWLSQAIYTALVSGLKPALLSYRWIKKLWKSILPSGLKRWLDLIGNTFTAPSTLQDCHGTMQPSSGSRSLGLGST